MVDSGSDVSTLQREVIESLQLKPVRTIESRGIHSAAKEKDLFDVELQLGTETLVTDVSKKKFSWSWRFNWNGDTKCGFSSL